jgi:hypothetical protein
LTPPDQQLIGCLCRILERTKERHEHEIHCLRLLAVLVPLSSAAHALRSSADHAAFKSIVRETESALSSSLPSSLPKDQIESVRARTSSRHLPL